MQIHVEMASAKCALYFQASLYIYIYINHFRYIDPTSFIKFLGLDAGVQQDAQEFSKLLLSLLEDTLCQQEEPQLRFIVQNQFRGGYDYVTRWVIDISAFKNLCWLFELNSMRLDETLCRLTTGVV